MLAVLAATRINVRPRGRATVERRGESEIVCNRQKHRKGGVCAPHRAGRLRVSSVSRTRLYCTLVDLYKISTFHTSFGCDKLLVASLRIYVR